MICVIIPVLNNIKWTDDCLKSLEEGTILPPEIIIIDNGSTDPYKELVEKYRSLNILYIRNEENIGVNAAWNLGLSITKRPYVLFLNNDTYANKYFLEKVIKTMKNPEVGICVPERERSLPTIHNNAFIEENPFIEPSIYIEGWAFTMRKSIFDTVGPIPPLFKTFMGDTYFFEHSKMLGFKNMKMINNRVYHFGSRTLKDFYENNEIKDLHKKENREWKEYLRDFLVKTKK